ncbi:MDR family oxidoreductase [Aliagarivorans taiwanensis]|uniref:acrylyl-CoA reductase (NADPH) n=1 Tax=Aliagarivorans taiwanensis TaxID=561966 RepID=UPI00041F57CA|nr:MDR family oxidoreductase [Aliagarivorans taiwanensis]
MFKALVLEQSDSHAPKVSIQQVDEAQLPEGDVRVAVDYSSLNFKDGLAITGKGKIVRSWPMVPGIDFVGSVEQSEDPRYQVGDKVVLTGWGVGEGHWGGMAEKAQVKGDWLVPLTDGMSEAQSMMVGTAGLTAMLCVLALQEGGVTPESGTVLVTGASGGVGSVAVTLLAKLGYQVAALTGRVEQNAELLKELGASEVVDRATLSEPGRPLDKQRWAGAVDTVGGDILANILAQTNYGGTVAACGLAASFKLPSTVMPFILRNVRLQGVDSVSCPRERRIEAWKQLQALLPESYYQSACKEVSLDEVAEQAEAITQGQVTGRVIIKP